MNNLRIKESKRTDARSSLKTSCDLEYLLIGDLRLLLHATTDSQTQPSLLVLLDRLLLNLPDVLELSSKDGYLGIVRDRGPNWSRQIDELHQANLDCITTLALVRNCLENDQSYNAFSKELALRLQEWIESFSAIRYLESTMLQEGFTVELGGEA